MDSKEKNAVFPFLWDGISCLLLLLFPRLLIFFASDIAKAFSGEAEEVLSQWKSARVVVPVYLAVFTGAALHFWRWLGIKIGEKKGKRTGREILFIFIGVLYFLICLTWSFLLTRVNGIPVHTVIKVVLGIL